MGTIEQKGKALARRHRTKFLILETVKVAGLISVAVVAPNILGAMAKMGIIATRRHVETTTRSYKRLIAAGLLQSVDGKLRLTERGRKEYDRLSAFAALRKQRRWDGKWRVLIFDIPSRRKGLRDKTRRLIQDIGFVRLQDSVWAYPYDCEDLLTLLKADLRIGKDLLYMVVDSLEGDRNLRKEFRLPLA